MKKHKKIFKVLGLTLLCGTVLAGCGKEVETTSTEFMFGSDIAFTTKGESEINIDFEKSNSSINEKYEGLFTALNSADIDKIAIGSTTTVNMLSEIGFLPNAAPESKSLKPELAEKLYNIGEEREDGILNIGSALSPNIEILAKAGTELLLLSDALPPTKWEGSLAELGVQVQRINQSEYSDMFVILQAFKDTNQLDNHVINVPPTKWEGSLAELGVQVQRINQSEYSDMFVILQAFKDTNQLDNHVINEKMLSMKNDLQAINEIERNDDDPKNVAIFVILQAFKDTNQLDNHVINEKMLSMKNDLQAINEIERNDDDPKNVAILVMSETTTVNGDESVLGKVVKQLSLNNVFGSIKSSELNSEEILMKNPEYLIIYGEGLTREELTKMFEEKFMTSESALANLQAVKDGKCIFIGDDTFQFMGSIDFNITKVMRQIVEGIYASN